MLHPLAVRHQVDAVADDGWCRVAAANILSFPQEFGTVLGPFLEQTCLLRYSRTLRPAPLRPVVGPCSGSQKTATQDTSCKKTICHWITRTSDKVREGKVPR